VAEKTGKMIRIKWVRSGIGFTRHQKTIVRSLGLSKLNHTVLRPDTPQIRGIVAAVPHLLEIVPEPVAPAWASIPEYTVHAPVAAPVAPAESHPQAAPEEPAAGKEEIESSPEGSETASTSEE
jgi:large subunit ribosomal protein L30